MANITHYICKQCNGNYGPHRPSRCGCGSVFFEVRHVVMRQAAEEERLLVGLDGSLFRPTVSGRYIFEEYEKQLQNLYAMHGIILREESTQKPVCSERQLNAMRSVCDSLYLTDEELSDIYYAAKNAEE